MSLVRRKHFANILSSSEEIRNIYRLAQHITHLISILVLLLSSLDQCPVSRWPSVNIDTTWLDSCHAPRRTDHLLGHLSLRTQAKSSFTVSMRSFVVFPCMLRLIRRHSLSVLSHFTILFFVCKGFKFNKWLRFASQQRLIDIDYSWARFNRA